MKTARQFHQEKYVWHVRVNNLISRVDDIVADHMRGTRIGMGRLYQAGYRTAKVGEMGIALRARMSNYDVIKKEKIHESIASLCKLVESASSILERITEAQGTPVIAFPRFKSELLAHSTVELSGRESFAEYAQQMEGEKMKGEDE